MSGRINRRTFPHGANDVQQFLCREVMHRDYGGNGNLKITNNFYGSSIWGCGFGGFSGCCGFGGFGMSFWPAFAMTAGYGIMSWLMGGLNKNNNTQFLGGSNSGSYGVGGGGGNSNSKSNVRSYTKTVNKSSKYDRDAEAIRGFYDRLYKLKNNNAGNDTINQLRSNVQARLKQLDNNFKTRTNKRNLKDILAQLDDLEKNKVNNQGEIDKAGGTNPVNENLQISQKGSPANIQPVAVTPVATPAVNGDVEVKQSPDKTTTPTNNEDNKTKDINNLADVKDINYLTAEQIKLLTPEKATEYLRILDALNKDNSVKATLDPTFLLLAQQAELTLHCAKNENFMGIKGKSATIDGPINNIKLTDNGTIQSFQITAQSRAIYTFEVTNQDTIKLTELSGKAKLDDGTNLNTCNYKKGDITYKLDISKGYFIRKDQKAAIGL